MPVKTTWDKNTIHVGKERVRAEFRQLCLRHYGSLVGAWKATSVWVRVQELGFAVFLAHVRDAKGSIAFILVLTKCVVVAEVSVKASKVTGLAAVGIVNRRLTSCRCFIVVAPPS